MIENLLERIEQLSEEHLSRFRLEMHIAKIDLIGTFETQPTECRITDAKANV